MPAPQPREQLRQHLRQRALAHDLIDGIHLRAPTPRKGVPLAVGEEIVFIADEEVRLCSLVVITEQRHRPIVALPAWMLTYRRPLSVTQRADSETAGKESVSR